MKISCICLTAGRPAQLNEAVQCFLNQTYQDKELVILNTFPEQQIAFDHPQVIVLNANERPRSLGEARNYAIGHSIGDIVATWDDDDLYLPQHLDNFAKHFTDGVQWVWQPTQFYVSQNRIQGVVKGTMNVVAFRRKAFSDIGGYTPINCGEDRHFVQRLTQLPGVKIPLDDFKPSFLYCWGQGVYHVSGLGDDKPGRVTSWERAGRALQQKLNQGLLKRGTVEIKPGLKHDYEKAVTDFIDRKHLLSLFQPAVCIVLLGRYGDIVNALPMAQLVHDGYDKPHFMVAQEFKSVLEGVSYVHPHPVPLKYEQINEALRLARKTFPIVINAGIYGRGWKQPQKTESFNRESWFNAGFNHRFQDGTLRPLFDRRDPAREEALWNKLRTGQKPVLLTQLTSISSPFPHGNKVFTAICDRWQSLFDIIDLSEVRAERIYDLLGLLDRASCLIAADTALLHLAAGTNCPVVALVNPQKWAGSVPRANCVRRLTYTEAALEVETVNGAIKQALNYVMPKLSVKPPQKRAVRRLVHVVERHDYDKPDARVEQAQTSWDALYTQGVIPAHFWEPKRDARQIGDKRALPYLKDVLSAGMQQVDSDDIIFWCNDDNWIHPNLPAMLRFHVGTYGAVTSQRCEFKGRNMPSADKTPEHFAKMGGNHMGRDLFAATKSWLEKNWDTFPDFLLGASDFDLCLACMVRLEKGVISTRKNLEQTIHPCELQRGFVSHVYHPPKWAAKDNESSAPSQIHNRELFYQWAQKHMPSLKFHPGKVI